MLGSCVTIRIVLLFPFYWFLFIRNVVIDVAIHMTMLEQFASNMRDCTPGHEYHMFKLHSVEMTHVRVLNDLGVKS